MYGNNVFLTGNLTKPIETAYTQSGKAVSKFSIGWNYKDKGHFFECVAWELPDFLRSANKGDKVCIEGSLQQDTWQDKTTGKNRSKTLVNVSTMQIVQRSQRASADPQVQAVQNAFAGDYVTPLGDGNDEMPY